MSTIFIIHLQTLPDVYAQVPLLFSVNQLPSSDWTPSPDHIRDRHPSVSNTLPIEPIEHDHTNTQSHRPIRTTRFIQSVDEEAELASFERSRSRNGRDHSEQSALLLLKVSE